MPRCGCNEALISKNDLSPAKYKLPTEKSAYWLINSRIPAGYGKFCNPYLHNS